MVGPWVKIVRIKPGRQRLAFTLVIISGLLLGGSYGFVRSVLDFLGQIESYRIEGGPIHGE